MDYLNKENKNDIEIRHHFEQGNIIDKNRIHINDYICQSNVNYLKNPPYNLPLQIYSENFINNKSSPNEYNLQDGVIKGLSQKLFSDNNLSSHNSPIQPEFSIDLREKLTKLSKDTSLPFDRNINHDRNSLNYFNFSADQIPGHPARNEFYTFNNRFFPQVNYENNMSSFTLANNTSINNSINENILEPNYMNHIDNQSFVNNSNSYNFPQVRQGDININNLMIGASCVKNNCNNSVNINNPLNSYYPLNTPRHDHHENLQNNSNSLERDCIFQDKNGFNINTTSNFQNFNQAFSQLKSFNCLDADFLNDNNNYSSILNKKTNLAKVNTNINHCLDMNLGNSFPSYYRNHIDNYHQNNVEMQTDLTIKNSNQPFNCNYSNISGLISNNTSNYFPVSPNKTSKQNTHSISPSAPLTKNGLSVSPKSAFVKNFEINVDKFEH
jgi:hypothetical protein